MDGTLISVPAAQARGLRAAMHAAYGLDIGPNGYRGIHQGNTQPNIVRAIAAESGVSLASTEANLPVALQVMAAVTVSHLDADLGPAVLPGISQLLRSLQAKGHTLGMVTGTVRAIAEEVINRAHLSSYFSACSYGDEGQERADLVQLLLTRLQHLRSDDGHPDGLVIVGDAPRDIQTGKLFAARTVAVATGAHKLEELLQFAPDVAVSNFADHANSLRAILSMNQAARASKVSQ